MKKIIAIVSMLSIFTITAHAGETATPQEVFDNVLKGMKVLESLGEEGLEAFNNPNGEFVWKDTYVQVYNCEAKKIVGHINPKLRKWTTEQFTNCVDKKGNHITKRICDASKNPNGDWVEYWWPKAGETQASRKITFVVQVADMPFQVSAGIYDDKMTLEELREISQ